MVLGAVLSFCYSVFPGTSCSSPTAVRTCSRTLVTCYQQRRRPLEPVRWTRGRCRGHMNSDLYALHSTDVTREVRPVRRLLVTSAGSWFLLDETFAVVLTNRNTVADGCSTVLLHDRGVRWSVFYQLTQHAPYVTLTDRRLAPRGRRRCRRHHRAVPGRGSSSWESLSSPADEDVAVQHFTDICRTSACYLTAGQPFSVYLFSFLSFGDPLDSRVLRF